MNKKKRNTFKSSLFNQDINTDFADNRERFRLYNKMYKQPTKITFLFISFIAIILSILPFMWPDATYSFDAWMCWGFGLFISIFFEQISNYHYFMFSKVAKKRSIDSVKFNLIVNKVCRLIAMLGWVSLVMAIAIMVVSNDGTIASIW